MKRKITFLSAALMLLAFLAVPLGMRGQSDYSTDYTGNITLSTTGGTSASTCKVVINNTQYDGIKAGTGSVAGAMKIMVPANTQHLHMHVAAWNNSTCSLAVTPTGYSEDIALTANSGVSGNSPFTFSGDPSTADYYKVITFADALEEDTEFTFTAVGGKRFVIWGCTAEAGGGIQPVTPTITFSGNGYNIGNSNPVGTLISHDFTVSQSNLTEDITLTVEGNGAVNPTQIAQGAGITTVTWSYTPEAAGEISATITATSGETTATFTIIGAAKAVHNVNIASMTNGEVTTNKTSAVEGEYVALYITPDQGYILDEITVTGDDSGEEVTITSSNSFQMPDEDVTISATFVPAQSNTFSQIDGHNPVAGQIYLIVDLHSGRALTSANGTQSAPAAVEVTIQNNQISTDNTALQWTFELTDGGYIIRPAGSSDTWLYSTATNNGVRVGNNNANVWTLDVTDATNTDYHGFKHNGTGRYLGVYNESDWRAYTTVHNNIKETQIALFVLGDAPSTPFITAQNVDLEYNAISGAITYTISNPVEGGTLTAAAESDWLTLGTVGDTILFTCTVNEAHEARTATVTLSYVDGEETLATKDVTVTQAAAPVIYDNIEDLFNAATSNETDVTVSFESWFVTGVSTNGKNVFVTDGTNGFVIYDNGGNLGDTYHTNDLIEGTATASLVLYNGFAELKNVDATNLTMTSYEAPAFANVAMADLSGINTGALVHYDNLTCSVSNNKYYLSDGTTTLQVYNALYAFNALEEGKIYNIAGVYQQYNNTKEILPRSANDIEEVTAPSITLSSYSIEVTAEEAEGALDITYENLTITEAGDFAIQYYNAQGEEIEELDWISAEVNEKLLSKNGTTYTYYEVTYVIAANNGEARTAYFKVYAMDDETNLVYSNLVTVNQEAYVAPVPSITITPNTIDAPAEGAEGTLALAYENITDFISFDFYFCDANGGELEDTDPNYPDWIDAEIQVEDEVYSVAYTVNANEGEARTAYFKVYTPEAEGVYAIVTVNQAEYVVDYATLPFEFDGGRAAIANTVGLTQENLGSDYNNSPKLKFEKGNKDNDGLYSTLILKFNERPGTLTFDIKGNSFSGGTFKVQTSEDGVTYTDLESYTDLTTTIQSEEFTNLGENVRYIKWIYTEKVNGNVALGNIALTEYVAPQPFITVEPDILNVDAEQHLVNYFSLTYENIVADSTQCFTVHYYNAEGQEIQPVPGEVWMMAGVVKPNDVYQVLCVITANEGEARTAYFKVSALDAENNTVYSNLVTVNQEAAPQQYTLTVAPFENLELITFVNDEMVMEADSTIYVMEGDTIMLSVVALDGYEMETLMVNGVNHVNDIADDFTYTFVMPAENVFISATAVEEVPPTPGEWVMVSLNDLTEDDVFVIVGVYDEEESSYAMPNDGTGAPSAVEVTMVGNTLSGDIADNLKWNLSIGEAGYTFYPADDTATWLYCNNTNNGVRVGTNENNVFSMTSEGYLYNNATNRYIGIYNYQDWRCYTSINNNIRNQTFAFYKRVDESEIETYTLDITGYGDNEGGYYLIAPPVSMIRPTAENGFLTDEYDLYYFDQAQQGEEWRNYKAKKFFPASGKGYLYASQESTMLIFTGVPYNGNGEVALDYTEGASFAGWNLIGNPFGNAATIDKAYYRLNADGSEVNATTESSAIAAMEGVFVVAETVGETVTFTEQTNPNNNNEVSQISINVSMNRGESIDRAIVRFDNGNQLPKFQLNPNHTKVYFPQGENDYAIVRSANEGEMPVNFKAENNGTYTISINTENVEMDYLHLIDNMTGADVDLLANPSYSFEAKTTDYANRFRLVFNANTVNENGNETFAYFNGSEWVISNMGEATLQVVDLMGRVLSTETVNGNATKNLNQTPGVYMLRLVNGDSVKVQKVVVR